MTNLDEANARARRAHLTVAWGLTLASTSAYAITVLLTRDDLPAQLATHFGLDGRADQLMRTVPALAFQGAVVIGVPVLMLIVFGSLGWWRGEHARSFSGLLVGLSAGLTTLFVSLLLAHVGVADPLQVTLGGSGLAALGVGVALGLLTSLVLPAPPPRSAPMPVTPLPLGAGDKASWFGRATMRPREQLILFGGVVIMMLAAVLTAIWWLWLVAVGMALLVVGLASFQVRVDAGGVDWRGSLGLPRGHIDLTAIEGAAVVAVELSDFGGIGVRAVPGKLGLVTRLGPALSVTHAGGEFVATVDDPYTAASLIEGLVRAGRASPQRPAALRQ